MPDSIMIILIVALAFGAQVIIWIIKDIEAEKRKDDEIEHWLNGGKG